MLEIYTQFVLSPFSSVEIVRSSDVSDCRYLLLLYFLGFLSNFNVSYFFSNTAKPSPTHLFSDVCYVNISQWYAWAQLCCGGGGGGGVKQTQLFYVHRLGVKVLSICFFRGTHQKAFKWMKMHNYLQYFDAWPCYNRGLVCHSNENFYENFV